MNEQKLFAVALTCTSSLFFYPWVISALMAVTPVSSAVLGVVLPLLLGSVSLAGTMLALNCVEGRRRYLGLPLLLVIGLIVAASFLSVPLGFSRLIGAPGLLPAVWMVSFLLLAPSSSLFFLSLPERTAAVRTASVIAGVVSLFALLILLLIGPSMLAGESILPLIGFLWLYGVIGLPIIGILFIIIAVCVRKERSGEEG
ncbi:hypothetical protein RJ40_10605 [Methanofollis aquaemaris]|uniref:Uncharacterized protein n=1 Tax=Methanofollis aquaemaris TaxID=126734 RepID=A0A8A3S798_9EURY|nr:hypothetical protein [Methanofollis aquaemaris]QSZ67912.1 hypothetical protein RJ40_10605 [Methanofollis aquaemaris]